MKNRDAVLAQRKVVANRANSSSSNSNRNNTITMYIYYMVEIIFFSKDSFILEHINYFEGILSRNFFYRLGSMASRCTASYSIYRVQ